MDSEQSASRHPDHARMVQVRDVNNVAGEGTKVVQVRR